MKDKYMKLKVFLYKIEQIVHNNVINKERRWKRESDSKRKKGRGKGIEKE